MSVLEIRDLQVSVKLPDGQLKPILAGVNGTFPEIKAFSQM